MKLATFAPVISWPNSAGNFIEIHRVLMIELPLQIEGGTAQKKKEALGVVHPGALVEEVVDVIHRVLRIRAIGADEGEEQAIPSERGHGTRCRRAGSNSPDPDPLPAAGVCDAVRRRNPDRGSWSPGRTRPPQSGASGCRYPAGAGRLDGDGRPAQAVRLAARAGIAGDVEFEFRCRGSGRSCRPFPPELHFTGEGI